MPVGKRFPGKQWILNGNYPVIFDAGAWNQPKKCRQLLQLPAFFQIFTGY